MTYRSFSISPFFSNESPFSDRLNRIDNLFSRLTGDAPLSSSPAYNLCKKSPEVYELVVSVPGYSEEELDVRVLNNQLTICGKPTFPKEAVEEKVSWLHKGIQRNEFSLSFSLDHRAKICEATLAHGLLKIEFRYELPDEEKSQKIGINIKKNHAVLSNT